MVLKFCTTTATMSYFENQINGFKANLTSASSKIASKRTAAGPAKSAVSPTPSQAPTPAKQDLKRKRPEPTNIVFSQPADTGTGRETGTKIRYALEYLKDKDTPRTLEQLLLYLSLQHEPEEYKQMIFGILVRHEKVNYDKETATFTFRPFQNIKSAEQLLRFLQTQRTAQGLRVYDLREGWRDAEGAIDQLEAQGKLLVIRNKKDNHPRMVWPNDPTLTFNIDDEFQQIWHKIKLPEAAALADELEKAGLMPANKSRGLKPKVKQLEKKTKKPRKGGKTTNTHMSNILKDYSHLKK